LREVLESGKALECLRQNIEAQGGDPRVCDDPAAFLPLVSETVKVESPRSGFITRVDTTEIGHAIAAIGGGRVRIEDTIDPTVGFTSELKIGDRVTGGEAIGIVYCADTSDGEEAARRIQAAYHVGDEPPAEAQKLVKEVINE
jgi:thymidine phosphorylase